MTTRQLLLDRADIQNRIEIALHSEGRLDLVQVLRAQIHEINKQLQAIYHPEESEE